MMKPSLVLVLVLVAAPAAAQVPPAKALDANEQPIVKLGLFASKPDGSPSSAAYSTSDFDFGRDNQVYVSPCSMGASSVTSHVPTLAVAAWRTNGQVLQSSEGVAQVRVTWQRLRAAGRGVNEPPNVIDVTITPTDATTLDQVTLPEMGQCKPVTVRLQARYEPRLPASVRALMAPVVGGGAGRVAAGGSAGTGGGGVNVGSAAGAAAGSGGGGIRPIINRPGGAIVDGNVTAEVLNFTLGAGNTQPQLINAIARRNGKQPERLGQGSSRAPPVGTSRRSRSRTRRN